MTSVVAQAMEQLEKKDSRALLGIIFANKGKPVKLSSEILLEAGHGQWLAALALRNKIDKDQVSHVGFAEKLVKIAADPSKRPNTRGHCLQSLAMLSRCQPSLQQEVFELSNRLAADEKQPPIVRLGAFDYLHLTGNITKGTLPLVKTLEKYSGAGRLKRWWWRLRKRTGELELSNSAHKTAYNINLKWHVQVRRTLGRLIKTPIKQHSGR